jgi:ribonuclease P protein component
LNFSISKKNFSSVLSKSNVFISNNIKIYYTLNNNKKIGFILSRAFGSAVKRNSFKRCCRNLFLNNKHFNFTVIIKPINLKNTSYNSIHNAFTNFLNNNT